jgi:BlaI family penicillinase repressor
MGSMKEQPKLGDRELDIMKALWDSRGGTVAEVHELLITRRGNVAYTTVQTMLNRLEEKGHVRREKVGRAYTYKPVMKEPAAARVALRRVIDRFFGGDPAALATHLVEGSVSERDLARIEALIASKREGERK